MPSVTLRPTGAFHVGQDTGSERQKVYAYVPSDTLFSAMMVAWAQQGKANEIVEQFKAQPPFVLTSAFPCLLAKDDALRVITRLLPVPQVKLPSDEVLAPKKKKRVRWVSWGVFEKLCSALSLADETDEANFLQGYSVWLLKQERDQVTQAWERDADSRPWWTTDTVPHVALDRVTNAGALFHTGRVTFAEGLGLWFAIRGNASQGANIKSALALLADAGLGGFRSTGHGAFEWTWDDGDVAFTPSPDSRYAVTLARYAVKDQGEAAQSLKVRGASYQLVTVAGWCTDDALHTWRRKRLRMVTEGSVIGLKGSPSQDGALGGLVDVKPSGAPQAEFGARGVYRYGYAFPVGVRREALREVVNE